MTMVRRAGGPKAGQRDRAWGRGVGMGIPEAEGEGKRPEMSNNDDDNNNGGRGASNPDKTKRMGARGEPRPQLVREREPAYQLELQGSCGQVQPESVFMLTLKLGLITGVMQLNLQYHVTTSQKYI